MVSSSSKRRRITWIVRLSTLLREHAESLILALTLAILIRTFVVASFVVRSEQMQPTVKQGDLVLAYYPPFGIELPWFGKILSPKDPRVGDLVVFDCVGKEGECMGRIIAKPGDRVEMTKQRLQINAKACKYTPLEENGHIEEACEDSSRPILVTKNWQEESWGPRLIEPGQYWVMNDNRENSFDSRQFGSISLSRMRAKAALVWLSIDWGASSEAFHVRWSRSFTWLH